MQVTYALEPSLDATEFRRVLVDSGLGAIRPVDDLARLRRSVPDAVLLTVGEALPGFREELLALALRLGVREAVVEAGWLNGAQLRAAYELSAVVATPSLCFESFGLLNLEAMAASKPVVASMWGGPSDVVEDGVTGFLVNPLQVGALAERLERVLLDPNSWSKDGTIALGNTSVSDDGKTFTFKIRPGMKFSSGNPVTAKDAARQAAVRAAGLAIWDVYGRCEREGSLDSAIRNGQPNDFRRLRRLAPSLALVCFNGRAAARFAPALADLGYATAVLPSTSPAHAGMGFEAKLAAWRAVLGPFLGNG